MMDTGVGPFDSVRELFRWLLHAPPGTSVEARWLVEVLASIAASETPRERPGREPEGDPPWGWRERLWTVPAETRLGVAEVAEALTRPRSYVYARTGPKGEDAMPHRKLDGTLVFTAGELRAWVRSREDVVVAGPMESAPGERSLHALQ